jgi:hypothetical protein
VIKLRNKKVKINNNMIIPTVINLLYQPIMKTIKYFIKNIIINNTISLIMFSISPVNSLIENYSNLIKVYYKYNTEPLKNLKQFHNILLN